MSAGVLRAVAITAFAATIACLWFALAGGTNDPPDVNAATAWRPGIRIAELSRRRTEYSGEYAEILARPVFSPSRRPPQARPPEPPPETIEPPPMEEPAQPAIRRTPPSFVLRGVLLEKTKQAALIQTESHPDGLWLERGNNLDGWMVTRIGANGIDIESDGETASLTLYVDNSSN